MGDKSWSIGSKIIQRTKKEVVVLNSVWHDPQTPSTPLFRDDLSKQEQVGSSNVWVLHVLQNKDSV